MTKPGTRAAIYCRISEDTEGESHGVHRQEDDCRALADRLGLDVVDVFVDNDTGASTRSRAKTRRQFEAMLELAEGGAVDYLLAYSNSRLTRRPMEFERLLSMHERTGVRITTVVSGEDDLGTADGRMVARIKASIDAGEAERTAERVARKHLQNARECKPVGGTRPFGWLDDKRTIDPAEAALIRQAAKDIIDGVPLARIVDRWNQAGVATSRGARWSSQTVRQMMRSPRLAGYRIHRRQVDLDAAGRAVHGQWAAILDEDTQAAVVARLTAPEGRARVPRRGARHYLLTGLVRCGACSSPMYGNAAAGHQAFAYRCAGNGHSNAINGPKTDFIVAESLLRHVAAADLEPPEPSAFEGEARLGAVTEKIGELMGAYNAGNLTGAVVFPAVTSLETERDMLLKMRKATEAASRGPDVSRLDRDKWEAMDTDRRRAAAEVLIDAVFVRPASKRGNVFDGSRVDMVWKGGTK